MTHNRREKDTSNTVVASTACSSIIFARDIARQTAPACMEMQENKCGRVAKDCVGFAACVDCGVLFLHPISLRLQVQRLEEDGVFVYWETRRTRRTQEQHVVCVICSARSWQTERPTAIQSGTCGVPARLADYHMKTSGQ